MQPVQNELFLNSLHQHPHLFLENLETIGQLEKNEKLYFYDSGKIEREKNSYYLRSGSGIFWNSISSLVPAQYSSCTERDIRHLEQFSGALTSYFSLHVLRPDQAKQYSDCIKKAYEALYTLSMTYRSEGNKKDHYELVDRTIDSLKLLKEKVYADAMHKEAVGTYKYIIEKLKAIKPLSISQEIKLSQMIPVVEDTYDEIFGIKNRFIDNVYDAYKSRNNLFTPSDAHKAIATIMLEECDNFI